MKRVYNGFLKVDLVDINLKRGGTAQREILRCKDAVAVLCRKPNGHYVFVKQYRAPVGKDIIEVIAGGVENGETPEFCAIREVEEETGHNVLAITKIGEMLPSPGYSSETIHLYLAEIDENAGPQFLDKDEEIEIVCFEENDFNQFVYDGTITDAKTLLCWYRRSL